MPAIQIEPSDAQFAAMYLSFGSTILEDNQVTDYLIRVVQPRLSAIAGVQRAEILGGRTFALRAWLKPDRMAALNVSPSQVRQALAANNYLSAVGQTKGALVQLNLTATTDLRIGRRSSSSSSSASRAARSCASRTSPTSCSAPTTTTRTCASRGKKAVFMGVWVLPNANSLDVIERVREEIEHDPARAADRHGRRRSPSTRPTYINRRDPRGRADAARDGRSSSSIVIFLFLGSLRTVLVPVVAIPVSLIGAVFLMQVFGFTLNLLTLLAIVLSVGLVVDDAIVVVENVERHIREGKTPLAGGAARRARARRSDHRDDHHAGRGLRADRLPGRAHRRALPRVRVHAGGRGVHLGRRRADAVADDVVAPAARRAPARLVRAQGRARVRRRPATRYARAARRRRCAAARPVYAVWIVLSLLRRAAVHVLAERAGAQRGSGRRVRRDRRARQRDARAAHDRTRRRSARRLPGDARVRAQLPDHASRRGGFGGMVVKPWNERKRSIFPIQQRAERQAGAASPGVRAPAFLPPALPSAGHSSRSSSCIASTAEPRGAGAVRGPARAWRR